jgi:C4-dicarboxylate-specific signal transduction histidine kinase
VNPGPFTAEIDSFDLGPEAMRDIEEQDVFSSRGHFKTYLKSIHGVRVYRDGFGIRVDRDWLNLGRTATSGASYYSLRPKNTIGYVALSARANSQLEEKTDREGFKITPAYTTFVRLLDEFVKFSDQAQGLLRRNYLSFCRSHNVKLANVEVGTTPEELAEDVREGVAEIHGSLPALESVAAAVRAMENINALVNTISGLSESLPKSLVTRLNEYWAVVRSSATRARESLAAIQATIGNAERLLPKSQILAAEVQSFRERTADVFELASLGLTAEALSHEIQNISDQLRGRARRATDYIRRESVIDSELLGFAEYVGSSVDALRKQLGHLEPSLRFARDKREEISILEFLRSLSDFYRARLDARGIAMEVTAEGSGTFKVMMSRGKLTQVFDNLILNSEYWLGADLEAEEINTGAIHLVVDAPHVRISDSGRGVAPDLELSLFEPFVSGKARGRGRGLGLYIVKQLLEADGCAISLLPSRNERERRFVFDIDFTGTLASATP